LGFGDNDFPDHKTTAVLSFRQSFISTGAGAFFFGATGAAVNSDHSLSGAMGEVVSCDGSLFGQKNLSAASGV